MKKYLVYLLFAPSLVFMVLNVATYSPGKTVDIQPTTARQFYNSLDSIPDGAIVVGHTWGHPDLVIGYYSVNNQDRFDYVNYDSVVNETAENTGYTEYQLLKGIIIPPNISYREGERVVDIGAEDFAKKLKALNPGRDVYVTFVKSSKIPMEFGLVPASEYRVELNDVPVDKIQYVR